MAELERLSLNELPPQERSELETAMRERTPSWLPDNNDIFAGWLFLVIGGAALIGVEVAGVVPLRTPVPLAALLGIALLVWTGFTAVTTVGKRGLLSSSFGTWRIIGRKLTGVRHDQVAALQRRNHGKPGKGFTVFVLVTRDGQQLSLTAQPRWVDVAVPAIQRGAGREVPVTSS